MRHHSHRGRRFFRAADAQGGWGFMNAGPAFQRARRIFRERSARGFYRSRSGLILGVCKGLADYFDLSVGWVRVIVLLVFIFSGFWPMGMLYLAAALIMKPEPVIPPADEAEEEFYSSYATSRAMALNRLKSTFQGLERRLQRLEHTVTSKEFNWQNRV
jgi:phage shock protein C